MPKHLLLIIFLFIIQTESFSQDSVKITNNYMKQFEELRTDNKILKEKVDVLNSTNDKILNSVYWTIGTVLAALIGLSVWNTLKSQRLNDSRFNEHLKNTKNQLISALPEQMQNLVNQRENSEIKNLKTQIKYLSISIDSLREQGLIAILKLHPYNESVLNESNRLLELLRHVTRTKQTSLYEDSLVALYNYLGNNIYFSSSDKSEILDMLENDFSSPNYKINVEEIKQLLIKLNA